MDGGRLEGFVRKMAGAAGSRRAVTRGLAGLGIGVLVPLVGSAEVEEEAVRCAKPGRACGRGKKCCNGLVCRTGKCACASGKTICGARCRNLKTDPANCGSCGFACPAGAVCAGEFCVRTIGGFGDGVGKFASPRGIAVSGRSLVVADTNNSRVQVLAFGGGEDFAIGKGGARDGQFSSPSGVAVAGDGTIFVADTGNARIQKFDADGAHLLSWGDAGSGQGQFSQPVGVAVDRNSNVWVVDTGNGRIQRFNENGFFLDQFGRPGDGDGELDEPTAIAVDLDRGTVFVADTGNQRVSVFDVDGGFIRTFGLAGTGDGEFTHPQGIAVNGSGTVFVTDFANPRVQAFNQDGQFLSAFGEGGSDQAGSLDSPVGIAIGRDGARHVVDSGPDRIVTFSPVSQL